MRRLGGLALIVAAGVLLYAAGDLPRVGDPGSPPATHVSPYYITQSHAQTGAPNLVTAVLADYRGYDTLGETAVIFTAGLACLFILGAQIGRRRE